MEWGTQAVGAVVAGLAPIAEVDAAASNGPAPGAFASLMQQQLVEVNGSVSAAEAAMHDLAVGNPVQLHDVMISLERARISVQTFVQVRNKLIEAYQDLMRMQL